MKKDHLVTIEMHGRDDYSSYSDGDLKTKEEAKALYEKVCRQVRRSFERYYEYLWEDDDPDRPAPGDVDYSEAEIDTELGLVYGNDLKAVRVYRVVIAETFPDHKRES